MPQLLWHGYSLLMNKLTNGFLRVLLMFFAFKVGACDVCNMYDYSGRQNLSYVGVYYRYRVMNGYSHINPESHHFLGNSKNMRVAHDIEGESFYQNKNKHDFQKYRVVDLRFNYSIRKKLNIGAIVPFSHAEAYYSEIYYLTKPVSDSCIKTAGLGDLLLLGDYVFSKKSQRWRTFIKPGFALKLPTGNSHMGVSGSRYPHEVQSGTGTIDALLRVNANARYRNFGLEGIANYRFNGKNGKQNYKFGNSLNLNLNPYYVIELSGELSLVPKIGFYMEMARFDHRNKVKQLDTGGNTWYANFGLDVAYGKINIQAVFQKPVENQLNGEQIGNAGRAIIGVIYNF